MTTVVGLVFWFMLTLQCHPVSFFWTRVRLELDPTAPVHGSCLSVDTIIDMAYVYSVTATCCDFTLGILPVFLVWNLQMNVRTKAALAGILAMGCVASAAVIVRIPYLPDYKDEDFLCKFTLYTLYTFSWKGRLTILFFPQTQPPTSLSGPTSKPVSVSQQAVSSHSVLYSAGSATPAIEELEASKPAAACRSRA